MDLSSFSSAHRSLITIDDFIVPGYVKDISVRLYRPINTHQILPVVLYLHGGGFTEGTLADSDTPSRFIAVNTFTSVLSVAYSLAPSYPFPAAPEDAYAAALWLIDNANDLRVDPKRLAIVGDDAGGNIAAATSLIARDRKQFQFKAQALIGPMLDPSMTKLGNAIQLHSDTNAQTCAQSYSKYLPRVIERLHPYACPAESHRLNDVPPTFIATAEKDVLRCEAEHFATALINAGIPTQITRFAITHSELIHHQPLLMELALFLKTHLHLSTKSTN